MKVRIRMYNAGLGDCFLVTFDPGLPTEANVLIDCGVLVGTENAAAEMTKRVDHIATTTKGHLNLVVATHEHWDHVSGFSQARAVFDDKAKVKTIDEIWFAWTEAPADALANRLRADRDHRKQKLNASLALWETKVAAMKGNLARADAEDPEDNQDNAKVAAKRFELTQKVLAFGDTAVVPDGDRDRLGVRATTKDSLQYLKDRPERKQYLEPGHVCSVPGLAGVRVFVLGPPRDEQLLKKGRPSKKAPETYLADRDDALTMSASFFAAVDTITSAETVEANARPDGWSPNSAVNPMSHPFDPYYRVPATTPREVAALGNQPDSFYAEHYYDREQWRRIDDEWLAATSGLAIALDNDTNNTSLVLAFELPNGDVLLFPADAQIGNWLSWQNVQFKLATGEKRVTTDDLLSRTVFYKVGHHASHNATLRDQGLEKMTHPRLSAMIPVEKTMAEKQGWAMPFPPLFERLAEKCRGRVLRLDDVAIDEARVQGLHGKDREAFATDFNPLYVELTIDTDTSAATVAPVTR